MLFGGLAALPLAFPGFMSVDWDAMSIGVWAAVAYSTVLVAAFGFFAWQKGASLTLCTPERPSSYSGVA